MRETVVGMGVPEHKIRQVTLQHCSCRGIHGQRCQDTAWVLLKGRSARHLKCVFAKQALPLKTLTVLIEQAIRLASGEP